MWKYSDRWFMVVLIVLVAIMFIYLLVYVLKFVIEQIMKVKRVYEEEAERNRGVGIYVLLMWGWRVLIFGPMTKDGGFG